MKGHHRIVSLLIIITLMIVLPFASSEEEVIDMSEPATRTSSFINQSSPAGLRDVKGDNLAWGDFNNDDYLDLLIRGPSSNLLFRNNGPPDWDFTDVSGFTTVNTSRGYSQWADYNNDGYLDFYSAGIDDHLFRNNGPPLWGFTDVTLQAGNPNDDIQSEGICWIDYDRDGYPDIFTVGWRKPGDLQWPYAGEPDKLYHNNGDGTFSDVSLSAGLRPRATSYAGMGVVTCDPNMDGWPDIYVSNYHLNPNQLWINNRDGTFTDMAFEFNLTGKKTEYEGNTYYGHCNGAGWADIDNDLDMDVFVSHLAHKDDERSGMNRGYYCADSQLFLNHGPPYLEFEDIREDAGIPITPSGTVVQDPDSGDLMWKDEDYFGVAWGDMDNDGDLDLWVPQVKTYSFWDHSFMWENNGDLTFTDSTDETGLKVWSNTGGTWADYNNDGTLDFCTEGTVPFKGPRQIHLYYNYGNSNHWIELDLNGHGGEGYSSLDATGAKVELIAGGETHMRYVGGDCGGHGFQQPHRLHFGLGTASSIDKIWVYWPSGRIQLIEDVSVGQILEIDEPVTAMSVDLSGPEYLELDEDEDYTISPISTGAGIQEHLWDLDLDGFDDGSGSSSVSFSSDTEGIEWVRYRVKDDFGLFWDLEPIIVNVSNVPPELDLPDSLELYEFTSYNLTINVTDTFSDIDDIDVWVKHHDEDDFRIIGGGPDYRFTGFRNYELGDHELQFMVTDDDGAYDIHSIQISVINKVPEVELKGWDFITEGEDLLLHTSVEDTMNDDLEYRFHSGDGRNSGWQKENSCTFTYTENGTFTAAVEVMDSHGDVGIDSMDIVVSNYYPTIISLVPDWTEIIEDETVGFSVRPWDTENDIDTLEVLWDFGDGSTGQKWSSSLRTMHTFTKSGDFNVTVSVRDNDGAVTTDVEKITVLNVEPTIVLLPLDMGSIYEDSTFTINAELDDSVSDRDILEHMWDLGDGNTTDWTTGDPGISHVYERSGFYQITLMVRDDDVTVEDSYTLEVKNFKPEIELKYERTVDMDKEIRFDASRTSDTPSDIDGLRFLWDLDDGHMFEGPSVITYIYREAGSYDVRLTVKDDDEYRYPTELVTVTVTNPPPVADLSFNESVYTGDAVLFDFSDSYDTRTDDPNLTYTLDPGDGSNPIITSNLTITYEYSKSGQFEVELTVSDENSEVIEAGTIYVYAKDTDNNGNEMLIGIIIIGVVIIIMVILMIMVLMLVNRSKKQAPPPPPPPGMMMNRQIPPDQPPQNRQLQGVSPSPQAGLPPASSQASPVPPPPQTSISPPFAPPPPPTPPS